MAAMNERIWVEPLDRSALLLAVLRAVAQPYLVIIEGDACSAVNFPVETVPNQTLRTWPSEALECPRCGLQVAGDRDALSVHAFLMPHRSLRDGVEAIQVVKGELVLFLVGDGFHKQCLSESHVL